VAYSFHDKVKVARALANGDSPEEAGQTIGADRATVYRFISEDEDFKAAQQAVEFVDAATPPPLPEVFAGPRGEEIIHPYEGTAAMNAWIREQAGR
jgi:hypothetical protein